MNIGLIAHDEKKKLMQNVERKLRRFFLDLRKTFRYIRKSGSWIILSKIKMLINL